MYLAVLKRLGLIALALFSLTLTGCATTGANGDPRDPLEGFNRGVYGFNKAVDNVLIKPVTYVYRAITPQFVDTGISNFFSNINDISVIFNDLLQGKFSQAMSDVARFLFNSTLGILGFFDVASNMDFPKHNEDFGQTLGVWGFGPGPYLVAPFFGPTSLRDMARVPVDGALLNPIFYLDNDMVRAGLLSLNYVDFRSDLLTTQDLVEEAAIDEYEFIKNAYFQRRESQVRDSEFPEFVE